MSNINSVLGSYGISAGDHVQRKAIKWNNNKDHKVLGFLGARAIGVFVKPIARIGDVAIHVILAVGKIAAGTLAAPYYIAKRLKNGEWVVTSLTVKQGLFHLGFATVFFADIFVSPIINLISPNICPIGSKAECAMENPSGEAEVLMEDPLGKLGDDQAAQQFNELTEELRAARAAVRTYYKAAKTARQELEAERKNLEDKTQIELKNLQDELNQLQVKLKELTREKEESDNKCNEIKKLNKSLELKCNNSLEGAQRDINHLQGYINHLQAAQNRLQEQLNQLIGEKEESDKKFNELKNQKRAEEITRLNELRTQNKLAAAESKVEANERKEQKNELSPGSPEILVLEQKIADQEQTINELREQVQKLGFDCVRHLQDNQKQDGVINSIRRELNNLRFSSSQQ